MKKIVVALLLFCACKAHSPNNGMLLNEEFVDLKGKTATTIIVNETPDTLKLDYQFFNWLPYVKIQDSLVIAPNARDTIKLDLNFPDKIYISGRFFIYNAPGKTLTCHIKDYKSKNIKADFEGSLAEVNDYYLAYQQFLEHYDNESRVYYTISETIKDWNKFPAIGDSITSVRLNFLSQYKRPLPNWFKSHEHRRLLYKNGYRLLNALGAKEFHSDQKIKVNDNYHAFEKQLNKDYDMILNDTYLMYMSDVFIRKSKLKNNQTPIDVINKLYPQTDVGDVNLMFRLGRLYLRDKNDYDKVFPTVKFKKNERKAWLDSVVQLKLGKPRINDKPPAIKMADIQGRSVSLDDYMGKMVIVNFWAVWCMPCIEEFPSENKIYQKYRDRGLIVINICCDSEITDWKRISKRDNLQMVNLYSSKTDFIKINSQFNLGSLPRSILINREGKIVNNGFKRASDLSTADINELLN